MNIKIEIITGGGRQAHHPPSMSNKKKSGHKKYDYRLCRDRKTKRMIKKKNNQCTHISRVSSSA